MSDRGRGRPPSAATLGIDWAEVRREYETTDIGFNALQRRWGIKNANQITRRRDKEGWKRDPEIIAAALVTRAVADMAADDLAAKERAEKIELTKKIYNETLDLSHSLPKDQSAYNPDAKIVSGADCPTDKIEQSASQDAPSADLPPPPQHRTEPPEPRTQTEQRDQDDELIIKRAKSLAAVHSESIRQQVETASRLEALGLILTEQLMAVVTAADADERQQAQRALLSVNPDKDSLSSVAKAAQGLIQAAVSIKRQALGMDVMKPGPAGPEGLKVGRTVNEVLQRLPTDVLMKLREAAVEVSRLPPPPEEPGTIEGDLTE